jgi:thiopurine S-methyltransferase
MILMSGTTNCNKDFWAQRYKNGETGWDLQHPSQPLINYFNSLKNKDSHILIPGAGNSYEAEYLWKLGFKKVHVLDIALPPLKNFKERLPEFPDSQIFCRDFFEHKGIYDLIVEQTFFCALNPALRDRYIAQMHSLLKPKGKLIGLLFDFPLTSEGPPFGGDRLSYERQFSEYFNILTLDSCYNSETSRQDKEVFFIFEKK